MTAWTRDKLLEGFETSGLKFADDYEGKVWATLVRKAAAPAAPKVMLYVHGFVDYFFLAFTNATAFSPADTFPLTARAKILMMAESAISLITIALVASRAVGILN